MDVLALAVVDDRYEVTSWLDTFCLEGDGGITTRLGSIEWDALWVLEVEVVAFVWGSYRYCERLAGIDFPDVVDVIGLPSTDIVRPGVSTAGETLTL